MNCVRCNAELNKTHIQQDGLLKCPGCGAVYRRKASNDASAPVAEANPSNTAADGNRHRRSQRNRSGISSNSQIITSSVPSETSSGVRSVPVSSSKPVGQLATNRSLLKMILFGILTLGIYPLVILSSFSTTINVIASRYDGKKTMHYCLMVFIVIPITLGIGMFVWYHRISNRIGNELKRRNIDYTMSAGTFWLWDVFGILIIIGPFVYLYKLCKAMNLLSADYNEHG